MRRGRCCCNNMTFYFKTVTGNQCPYGRVKAWDNAHNLMFDGIADGTGTLAFPVPAASNSGWSIEISEVPRCDPLTVTPITLSAANPITVGIAYPSNYNASTYRATVKPDADHWYLATIDYPQKWPLNLDDSVYGTFELAFGLVSGVRSYQFYDPNSLTVTAATLNAISPPGYPGPGNCGVNLQARGSPFGVTSWAPGFADSWTPDGEGEFHLSVSGTRNVGGVAVPFSQEVYE